jgi:ferritin-like metal-binding protein YciE
MGQVTDAKQFFLHKLGATLTMEETIVDMLKELEGKANSSELKEQLSHHRDETQGQIANVTQAFAAFGRDAERKPCPVIDGLKEEGEKTLQETTTELHDLVILAGCSEVEHHEIAVYNGLIELADELGEDDVVALLKENLEQEEHTLKEVEKAFEEQTKKHAERVTA